MTTTQSTATAVAVSRGAILAVAASMLFGSAPAERSRINARVAVASRQNAYYRTLLADTRSTVRPREPIYGRTSCGSAFELQLDFRMGKGANSGIIYHVTEESGAVWATGPEIQLEDNEFAADAQKCGWL